MLNEKADEKDIELYGFQKLKWENNSDIIHIKNKSNEANELRDRKLGKTMEKLNFKLP